MNSTLSIRRPRSFLRHLLRNTLGMETVEWIVVAIALIAVGGTLYKTVIKDKLEAGAGKIAI